MRRLTILMLLAFALTGLARAAVETTTINDTVRLPDGTVAAGGSITAQLSIAGSAPDLSTGLMQVVGGRVTVTIDPNGRPVGLALVPNSVIVPANTYYTISFSAKNAAGTLMSWSRRGQVPPTPDPCSIGGLTWVDPAPTPLAGLDNLSDVVIAAPLTDQCLVRDSAGVWKNKTCPGGGHTIRDVTTSLATRSKLSFSSGLKATDNAGQDSSDVKIDPSGYQAPSGATWDLKLAYFLLVPQFTTAGCVAGSVVGNVCGATDTGHLTYNGGLTGLNTLLDSQYFLAKGDLLQGGGANSVVRQAIGSNGVTLIADSTQPGGWRQRAPFTVNGVVPSVTGANFSDTTPNGIANAILIRYQIDGTSDISGYFLGTDITRLGVITVGTWNGTAIDLPHLQHTGSIAGSKCMETDPAGLGWHEASGACGTGGGAIGSDKQVAFNNAGTESGDSGLTYDPATKKLTVGGSVEVADQTTAPGNFISVLDNDVNLTPDPTCANSGVAGELRTIDSDESASDTYDVCKDTSLLWRYPATSTTPTDVLHATATAGAPAFSALVNADIPSTLTSKTITTGVFNGVTTTDNTLVDLSGSNASTTTDGLKLPQNTSCSSATAEGQLCWDSDDDILYSGDGAVARKLNASGGSVFSSNNSMMTNGTTTLSQATCYQMRTIIPYRMTSIAAGKINLASGTNVPVGFAMYTADGATKLFGCSNLSSAGPPANLACTFTATTVEPGEYISGMCTDNAGAPTISSTSHAPNIYGWGHAACTCTSAAMPSTITPIGSDATNSDAGVQIIWSK